MSNFFKIFFIPYNLSRLQVMWKYERREKMNMFWDSLFIIILLFSLSLSLSINLFIFFPYTRGQLSMFIFNIYMHICTMYIVPTNNRY